MKGAPHRVAILVYDGVTLLDVAGPAEVFKEANRFGARYQIMLLSPTGAAVTSNIGVQLTVGGAAPRESAPDTLLVAGSDLYPRAPVPHELADAARTPAAGAGRVASICTGAFILAEAGLLDGRHATTHWGYCADLAARFPQVRVDPDVLYVDDGDVLTSAGLSAGMDLCLHVVRQELGAEVANGVARWNVVPPHRAGGQAQFIRTPVPDAPDGGLGPTLSWAQAHLRDRLDVAALARHAHMSERTFARRFRAETGLTPKQWLLTQRVLHARRLLERTDLDIEAVATEAGFGSAASLRIHFQRATSTCPTAYRATFRDAAPAAA